MTSRETGLCWAHTLRPPQLSLIGEQLDLRATEATGRGAIIWGGQPDPAGNRPLFAKKADKKQAQLSAIVADLKAVQTGSAVLKKDAKSTLKSRDGIGAKDIPTVATHLLGTLKGKGEPVLSAEDREALHGLMAAVEEIAGAEPRFDAPAWRGTGSSP